MYHSTIEITNIIIKAFANLQTEELRNARIHMSYLDFASEFGDIKLYLPRRTGITTAVTNILDIYKNSLLIVPTRNLEHMVPDYKKYNIISTSSVSINGLEASNTNYEIVIVDHCSSYKSNELEVLYRHLRHKCILYVELG